MKPYPYQKDVANLVVTVMEGPAKYNLCLKAQTGYGKTLMIYNSALAITLLNAKYRVIIVTANEYLMQQSSSPHQKSNSVGSCSDRFDHIKKIIYMDWDSFATYKK